MTTNRSQTSMAMRKWPRGELWVLALYLLLTILMTWPTVLNLSGGIPGDGFDGWQNYWNLWWVKEALLVQGSNPYFTDYLYPPNGTNLLFHTLNIFNGLWTLPIQLNFGLAIAYNSVVFFSFVLAGYGNYLLSLYTLTRFKFPGPHRARLAAFVGGLIFTMSPFHLAHLLGHMQVFTMIWPPFYILWLLRTLEPWRSSPPADSARDIALTCLFLILATLVDWYHTLYLLIFTGLVLVWTLWQRRYVLTTKTRPSTLKEPKTSPNKPLPAPRSPLLRPLWSVLMIGLGFALLLSPLLVPMIREAGARPDLQTGLAQNITLSADLLAFFIPSEMHPLWGGWAQRIADHFSTTTSERLIFVGFTPLALSLFITITSWRNHIVRFWTLVVALFFILALGPFLHIGGNIISVGDWPIPMPYLLLYNTVPFIGLTRSLSRYALMVMLGLGVLSALALARIQFVISTDQLTRKGGDTSKKTPFSTTRSSLSALRFPLPAPHLIPILAAGLICFEFLPIPYPVSKIDTPQFFYQIGRDPEDYTIAELPMDWDRPTPLLHQVTHQKRLLTAYTSRDNPRELAWRTPVFQHWRFLEADIIDQPLARIAPTIFFDFNLRYIVLDYWQMPPGPVREATEQWVSAALPAATPVYEDGRLIVYQAPPKQTTEPYLTLGQGWSDRQQSAEGTLIRTFVAQTEAQPELFLHHPQQQRLNLELTAAAPLTQQLTVFTDEEPVGRLVVEPDFSTQIVALPLLAGDIIKLSFRSDHPAGQIAVSRIGLHKP